MTWIKYGILNTENNEIDGLLFNDIESATKLLDMVKSISPETKAIYDKAIIIKVDVNQHCSPDKVLQ